MKPSCALLVVAACGAPSSPASPDAAAEPRWVQYVIPAGEHTARVVDGEFRNPIVGVTDVVGRDYELAFDATAVYELGDDDQYDWNKLPGLSDCGEIDLSRDGAMFGWRWRVDVAPPVLEIAAYANNAGVHLTSDVLVTLDAAALETPIRYTVAREAARYVFAANGVAAELPRRCAGEALDPLAWAGEFYFGGTSTAPHDVTARIRERSGR
ncbi:MAG: hypothetical protein KF773_17480 [Deltaproteobacteria bacterium]|nr:hypothetical protein [Deltaproteobacteria bacterium]